MIQVPDNWNHRPHSPHYSFPEASLPMQNEFSSPHLCQIVLPNICHIYLPLFALPRVRIFKSYNFLPNSSSLAINSKSLSIPPSACKTAAYVPIDTVAVPFSTAHNVARLIPALSATNSVARIRSASPYIVKGVRYHYKRVPLQATDNLKDFLLKNRLISRLYLNNLRIAFTYPLSKK